MRACQSLRCAIALSVLLVVPACSPACFLKPTEAFDQSRIAPPPDYTSSEAWAAFPGKDSKANMAPPGSTNRQAEAPADVFFIHPTTWIDRTVWNDPLTSAKSLEMIEEIILPGQASAFNQCCRVFAPRFRQATLGAYFADVEQAQQAFSIAREDLERAFEVFVTEFNLDRPFILAAHSQGSMHAMALLKRIDADPDLRDRLIVAYVPGFSHPMSHFGTAYKHLSPCDSPGQVGCVAAWDTYREGKKPDGAEPLVHWSDGDLMRVPLDALRQCTNPITWRSDEVPSKPDAHLGAVPRINEGENPSFWTTLRSPDPGGWNITGLGEPRVGLLTARCDRGVLRVPDLKGLDYDGVETSPGNYHLLDYELFYMDIQANAKLRTKAWLQSRPASTTE